MEIETPFVPIDTTAKPVLSNIIKAATLKECYAKLLNGDVPGIIYDAAVLNYFRHEARNDQGTNRRTESPFSSAVPFVDPLVNTQLLPIVDAPFTAGAAIFAGGQLSKPVTERLKSQLSSAIVSTQDEAAFQKLTEQYHFASVTQNAEEVVTDAELGFDLNLLIVASVLMGLFLIGQAIRRCSARKFAPKTVFADEQTDLSAGIDNEDDAVRLLVVCYT